MTIAPPSVSPIATLTSDSYVAGGDTLDATRPAGVYDFSGSIQIQIVMKVLLILVQRAFLKLATTVFGVRDVHANVNLVTAFCMRRRVGIDRVVPLLFARI